MHPFEAAREQLEHLDNVAFTHQYHWSKDCISRAMRALKEPAHLTEETAPLFAAAYTAAEEAWETQGNGPAYWLAVRRARAAVEALVLATKPVFPGV